MQAPSKAMVVDDGAVIRRLIGEVLKNRLGIKFVTLIADGSTALIELANNPPDVLVLDLEMPGLDGLEVLAQLRKIAPGLPVVMLSAAGGLRPDAAVRALDLGAIAFIDKPTGVRDLNEAMDQLTSQFRQLFKNLKAPARPTSTPLHILLVDDSPLNRHILQRLLSQLGHKAVTARDGIEADEHWHRAPFDAVLMDLEMPRCDGLTATANLRAHERTHQLKAVPVIAITATEDSSHLRANLTAAGMTGFLFRPFTLESLHGCLERASAPNPQLVD